MTDFGAVYVLGAGALLFGTVCLALAEALCDVSPRELLGGFGRRCVRALLWPIALPIYLLGAWRKDQW